jgi:hypothetical protein
MLRLTELTERLKNKASSDKSMQDLFIVKEESARYKTLTLDDPPSSTPVARS